MMGIRKKLEDLMVAISFAEAGDDKTAKEIMKRKKSRTRKADRVIVTQQVHEKRMELKGPSD